MALWHFLAHALATFGVLFSSLLIPVAFTRSLDVLAQAVCIALNIDPPSKRREVDPELELVAPEPDWWRGLFMAGAI